MYKASNRFDIKKSILYRISNNARLSIEIDIKSRILNLQMGTILQQSMLRGRQISNTGKEKDLLHKLFSQAAANYSSQLAIRYEGTYH